jgi:orotate phosphoribosyltransferase
MRELGLVVEHALCVFDREQGGRKNLEELGCSLTSVFTLDELERFAQEGEK